MPKIFDNIENLLANALNYTMDVSHKADVCVGFFNLCGWKQVADKITPALPVMLWSMTARGNVLAWLLVYHLYQLTYEEAKVIDPALTEEEEE